MAKNFNRDQFYETNRSDIRLSQWEYNDFIDAFMDDRLSAEALMKFKNLYWSNSVQMLTIPILMFPPAFVLNKWLIGFVSRGMASSRFNFFGMSIFYPITLYFGFTLPVPRKLYTDLIADQGDDGTYIRSMLVTHKPGLWAKISKQLGKLGFDFPEMNDAKSALEFPQGEVWQKIG